MKDHFRCLSYTLPLLFILCFLAPQLSARPPKKSKGNDTTPTFQYEPGKQFFSQTSTQIFLDDKPYAGSLKSINPDSVAGVDIRPAFNDAEGERPPAYVLDLTTLADPTKKIEWRTLPLSDYDNYLEILWDGYPISRSTLEAYSPEQIRSLEYLPKDKLLFAISTRRDGTRIRAQDGKDRYFYYVQGDGGGTSGRESDPEWLAKGLETLEGLPTFQGGGLDEFRAWVVQSINYPADAFLKRIDGEVSVSFVVDKTGVLKDMEVLSAPMESMGQEVIRILNSAPKWNPGFVWGLPIHVRYNLSVDFTL